MVATPSAIWMKTAAVVASIGSRSACARSAFHRKTSKTGRENCDGISQGAMRELGCQRVLKKVDVPGGKSVKPGRNDFAVHERPGVRGMPCLQTGHECASDDLQVDEARENAQPEFDRREVSGQPFFSLSAPSSLMERASQKA